MKPSVIACIAAILVCTVFVRAESESPKRRLEIGVSLDNDTQLDMAASYINIHSLEHYDIQKDIEITIPITIYRGSTLKRTVYVWFQDNSGKRVSSKQKFSLQDRFTLYNLSAILNFSSCNSDQTYTIIAQGLGLNETKEVDLDFIGCDQAGTAVADKDGKISFSVLSHPDVIVSGTPFKTRILISNPTAQDLEVDAWSYVYRSSTCYSGEREQNRNTINIPEYSNITFDLENTADAPAGEYNLKIKFLRSDRKTPDEMTRQIEVKDDEEGSGTSDIPISEGGKNSLSIKDDASKNDTTEVTLPDKRSLFSSSVSNKNTSQKPIYESSSAKARRLTVYFLILVLALTLIALVMKML